MLKPRKFIQINSFDFDQLTKKADTGKKFKLKLKASDHYVKRKTKKLLGLFAYNTDNFEFVTDPDQATAFSNNDACRIIAATAIGTDAPVEIMEAIEV